jgi:acyl dehydratase/putative sterol carrier protein
MGLLTAARIDAWEDYELGRTVTSEPRRVSPEDLEDFVRLSGDDHPLHVQAADHPGLFGRPVLHGTFGLALFTGFVRRMGLDAPALALLDTLWSYRAPIFVGDEITCEVTVTRKRLTTTPGRGIIHRHVVLRNQDGSIVQEGTSALLAAARGQDDAPPALQFGTPAWGEALTPVLEEDPGFMRAVGSYDGTIGIRAGREEVHFRIYRGRILETARRAVKGADFVLSADEHTWAGLILGPCNDFMKLAMLGRFTVEGNGAEYLRMTKALVHLVDAARTAARKGQ